MIRIEFESDVTNDTIEAALKNLEGFACTFRGALYVIGKIVAYNENKTALQLYQADEDGSPQTERGPYLLDVENYSRIVIC